MHRPLATRFGHDVGAATLTFRPLALWLLGYPKTALVETDRAIAAARETDHVPTLLFALAGTAITHICCRDHAAATAHSEECIALAQEKVPFYKMFAATQRGCVLAQTGKAADAIQTISAGIAGLRAIGATIWGTFWLAHLALAYAELGKFDDAWRCIGEAMARSKQPRKDGTKPRSIALPAKSRLSRPSRMRQKRKHISSVRSRLRVSNRQSPGNSAPR